MEIKQHSDDPLDLTNASFGNSQKQYAAAKIARESCIRVYEMSATESPRSRLASFGAEALSTAELLAIVINTGTGRQGLSSLDIGQIIVSQGQEVRRDPAHSLRSLTLEQLCQIPGVGEAKAAQIVAAIELGKRAWIGSKGAVIGDIVDDPDTAAKAFMPLLLHQDVECFALLSLDIKSRIIAQRLVSIGTVKETYASPREIFRIALMDGAARIVVAHNHPSGNPEPSPSDIELTKTLCEAGTLMGVPVLDHIVLGNGTFRSIHQDYPYLFGN